MNVKRSIRIIVIIGATLEFLVAIFHFVWPYNVVKSADFTNVPQHIREFFLLASLAIGLCLFIFAILSLYFSGKLFSAGKIALFFCLSQVVLWIIRLILEILYPVRIAVYSIERSGTIILIFLVIMILIYLIPLLLTKRIINI
jgi:hypothetical protein